MEKTNKKPKKKQRNKKGKTLDSVTSEISFDHAFSVRAFDMFILAIEVDDVGVKVDGWAITLHDVDRWPGGAEGQH